MYRAHCQSMILSKFAILRRHQGCQKKRTDFAKTNYQVSKHLAKKILQVRLKLGCLIIPMCQKKPLNVMSDAFKIVPNMIFNTLN